VGGGRPFGPGGGGSVLFRGLSGNKPPRAGGLFLWGGVSGPAKKICSPYTGRPIKGGGAGGGGAGVGGWGGGGGGEGALAGAR